MKKIMYLFFGAALVVSGCKKQLDINNNPNQPTVVTPNVILSAALVGTASNNMVDYLGLTRWMGYWSRSGNYVPDVQTETYNVANDYTDGEWGNIYINLNNYDYMEKTGRNFGFPFYQGVAKVMKAYGFATLVDIYNDVPYFDAFQVTTKIQPAYTAGQDIYNDLVLQLDSAQDYFEKAKTFYSIQPSSIASTDDQYDVLFGSARTGVSDYTGRLELWQRFTNTVMLKLLVHQSNVSSQAGLITAELAKIKANGYGVIGAGESAMVNPGYQASTGKISPLFGIFNKVDGTTTTSYDYYRANTYAVSFMANSAGDERQALLYSGGSLNPPSNFDGDPAALPNANTAAVGPGLLKGFSQDAFIMSDFESLFLQAEAVQRGWDFGATKTAQELYESAITQNWVWLDLGNEDIISDPVGDAQYYFSQGEKDIDWTASPDKLEAIITQKWAAMNGVNWVEAWTDYRRTGFPTTAVLDISHAPDHLVPQIPVRYLYPQSEYNTNGKNVPSLGSGAQFSSKIFWNQ